MKVDIQTVGFDANQELVDFVNDRIVHLSKYYGGITGVDVYLKSSPDGDNETKTAEIKVFVPGPSLFSDHKSDSFRESVIESIEKIKRQLARYKDKQYEKR